jgi:hypothetical protein
MESTNERKGMNIPEILAVWGSALVGGLLASIVIGLLGVRFVDISYPNSGFEHGAAIVGAFCGSFFSIPFGMFWGGVAGVVIYNFLSKRNLLRPALPASAAAFVLSALLSGIVLVPIGFLFFGLGHI